ncbi:MAG: pirin family protein [Deltaproteobacteria bacterium]|nr:pirin family protein [Deltaproteobacteria bacterium]
MITVRKSSDRGHASHGWLDTWHTFSFAQYQDPAHMGFRSLRVINDDIVAPSAGFPTHGHSDMEIVTWVLDGALQHKDSLGNGSVIRPGEAQRMTAGTGIRHSEFNASESERCRLLQIWILPERGGLEPGYEQTAFPPESRRGKLRLIASRDGREGSVTVHQDVSLYASLLDRGQKAELALAPGRHGWVQVAKGSVTLNGTRLDHGDGAALADETRLALEGVGDGTAEILVFDLG